MSYFSTTDFLIEVGKGNVLGHSSAAVVMRNTNCSNTAFTDVWGGGGNLSLPTAAESLEIVSSSANDTAAGTGARTVLISTLDADKDIQTAQTVTLNGTTAVALTGTHFRMHQLASTSGIFVLTAGSGETNEGDLTLRVSGGGATRDFVFAGSGKSESGQITVPNGLTALGLKVIITWPKDESGTLITSIKPFGTDTARISSGEIFAYQNDFIIDFVAKFRFIEKTDFSFRAKATNSSASLAVIEEFLVVENEYVSDAMAALQSFSM